MIPRCSEHIGAKMSTYLEAGRQIIDFTCAAETIPVLQTVLGSECFVNTTLQREVNRGIETSCMTEEVRQSNRMTSKLFGREKPANFNPCPLMIESRNCATGILGSICGVSWKTV